MGEEVVAGALGEPWQVSVKRQMAEDKLEYYRQWRNRNRDKLRAQSRVRIATPEYKAKAKAWREARSPIANAWYTYRNDCKRDNRVFALPRELFDDLITDVCFYCGIQPNPVNGIDRVDSSIGYVEDNVVTACRYCNRAKSDQSMEEFISRCKRIVERNE